MTAAFDLAVTAGLRHGTLHHLLSEAQKLVCDYEARKCSHLQTQELCSAQGIKFVPLGGWGLTAVKTWPALAQATAGQSEEAVSVEASRLYEMLAVTLQRENARAVLRRLPEPAPVPCPGAALLHPSRPHLLRWPLLGYVKLCACLPDPYYRSARMRLRGAVHNWACRWRLAVPPKARRQQLALPALSDLFPPPH